jgi:hypothetical protein
VRFWCRKTPSGRARPLRVASALASNVNSRVYYFWPTSAQIFKNQPSPSWLEAPQPGGTRAMQCTHGNHPCKTRIHPLPKYPAHHTWPIIYPETSTAPEIPPIAKSSGRPDLNTTIPNHMQPLEPHIPHEARSRFPPSHHGTHNGYTPYIL